MEIKSNKPIYLQLADQIMDEAFAPNCEPGARLLSVRDFAARSGVNANTVMRTYAWLQQEGLVTQKRGIGYFYSMDAREKILDMRRSHFFENEINYFFNRLTELGVAPEELQSLYQKYITDQK